MKEQYKVFLLDVVLVLLVLAANSIENIWVATSIVWILVIVMIVLPLVLVKKEGKDKINKVTKINKILLAGSLGIGIITGISFAVYFCLK